MAFSPDSSRSPVIVSACRTPVGRYGGALAGVRPDDLAAIAIAEALQRSGLSGDQIEDVILGCANQAGEDNRDVARMSLLLAGLPQSVGGQTVNRLCGSGLQALITASHAIAAGEGDAFIAGGVESMSRAPLVMGKAERGFDRSQKLWDTTLGWRFPNPKMEQMFPLEAMGETAENIAGDTSIPRDRQDAFALQSQQRWMSAQSEGRFADEVVAVEIPQRRGDSVVVEQDEHPRPDTTLEGLAGLRPAFAGDGSVTAGNSSGVNDGAAALVLTSAGFAQEHGLRARARVVASAVAGVDPTRMGLGPVPATQKALRRAGLGVGDLDLVELNEAFAVQALACIDALGLDESTVNVNGGSIAMGHPLGSTGARLTVSLLHELERRDGRYGLVTMCIGVGQGIAAVIERIAE